MEQITPGTVAVSDAYFRLFLCGTLQFNKTQLHTRDYFLDVCKNTTVIL